MRPCYIGLRLCLLTTRLRHQVVQPGLAVGEDVRGKTEAFACRRHQEVAPPFGREIARQYPRIDPRRLLQHCGYDPIGQRRPRKTLYEAHRKEAISGAWK